MHVTKLCMQVCECVCWTTTQDRRDAVPKPQALRGSSKTCNMEMFAHCSPQVPPNPAHIGIWEFPESRAALHCPQRTSHTRVRSPGLCGACYHDSALWSACVLPACSGLQAEPGSHSGRGLPAPIQATVVGQPLPAVTRVRVPLRQLMGQSDF